MGQRHQWRPIVISTSYEMVAVANIHYREYRSCIKCWRIRRGCDYASVWGCATLTYFRDSRQSATCSPWDRRLMLVGTKVLRNDLFPRYAFDFGTVSINHYHESWLIMFCLVQFVWVVNQYIQKLDFALLLMRNCFLRVLKRYHCSLFSKFSWSWFKLFSYNYKSNCNRNLNISRQW